jgi:thiamine pyrophosphokinase
LTEPRASHHVVIVADGDISAPEVDRLQALMAASPRPFLLAADGGAARCLGAGLRPDVVVGDFDSLDDAARSALTALGVAMQVADPGKDESDLELCLLESLRRGAERITVFGALGSERPEHGLANLLLLADSRLDGRDVVLVGHGAHIRRIGTAGAPGSVELQGRAGDYVSLLPVGGAVDGVATAGLRFPLREERLEVGPSRGLSNELVDGRARVTTTRGRLLVIHTPTIEAH